jgi:hypothetical protein
MCQDSKDRLCVSLADVLVHPKGTASKSGVELSQKRGRRLAVLLLKTFGEIRMRAEADLVGDLGYGAAMGRQQLGGALQADGPDKIAG